MILPELENGGEEAGPEAEEQLQEDPSKEADLRFQIKYVLAVSVDFQRIQGWTGTE
jgi:hypothetical protein